ncbi:MAG: hypothetical protein K0R02_952 [Rickettsiaceae bacterium]|jgi:hypothetical protein|nr:hypothetical protein [Rickettsiaceae bacterium]
MDIIDEVVKDIKDEKHYNAFKRILPVVLGVTILLVTGMGIKNWIASKTQKHNMEMGDLLNNAVVLAVSGQEQAAKESFDYILKEAKNNTKDLAALGKAIQLFNADKDQALKSFEEIADNKNFTDLTKSYAQILWLSIVIDLPTEKISSEKLVNYLNNFSDEQKTFFGTANLIKALWLMKKEKDKEAEETLNLIINSKYTNYTNKNNAQAILANIKAKKYSK